jgi:hypothetical protein
VAPRLLELGADSGVLNRSAAYVTVDPGTDTVLAIEIKQK